MSRKPERAPAAEIDLAEPCRLWRAELPAAPRLAREAALAALVSGAAALAARPELSIVLADDARVRALNRRWRGRDAATNVLAFATGEAPSGARPQLLGDVVLAYETVAGEARAQGKPLADHLRHLVVHGVLHLLGLDHDRTADAERMEDLERRILAGLGVPDPYRAREPAHG